MANNDGYKYTNKDYQSILQQLIEISPQLSQAYDPQSENDPIAFILKNMAMVGDMLSFYLDKNALETAPKTMTQRKIADAYYRMMGYYMSWYQPASTELTITSTYQDGYVNLPKYTTITSISGDLSVVLMENCRIDPATPEAPTTTKQHIVAYEGTVQTEYVGNELNIIDNRYELRGSRSQYIWFDSITVVDTVGSVWEQVEDIEKYPTLGKYYDVYVDEYDNIYIRFSQYLSTLTSTINYIKYVASRGVGTLVRENVLAKTSSNTEGGIIKLPSQSTTPDASTSMSSQSIVSQYCTVIANTASTESTRGPETAQEAYENSKYYINTTDTLVTVVDYQNAIRRISGISNCVVTDLVIEKAIKKQYDSGDTTHNESLDNSGITSFDYIVRPIWNNFDMTQSSGDLLSTITNAIAEYKMINLTCSISLDYYIMTWQPQGVITLSQSVTRSEADSILATVCRGLATDYHPSRVQFGEPISLVDVINSIKSYDERILTVDLKPIQYKITNPSKVRGNCDEDIYNLYVDFINGGTRSPIVSTGTEETSSGSTTQRHWDYYRMYTSSNQAQTYFGINMDPYPPTSAAQLGSDLDSARTSGTITTTEPLNPYEDGNPTDKNLRIDPVDFFDENHPYRRISIPRFANYEYYDGVQSALDTFKSYVTINEENIAQ